MNSPNKDLSGLSDPELYKLAKRLLSDSLYGNPGTVLKLEIIKDECLKRDSDMFADAMDDTMDSIAGRRLLSEGISIASIERGKYLNDEIYKMYADESTVNEVSSSDAYCAVGILKQNILICSVTGDSMINAGIRNGVKAIADKSLVPVDGNIIIARIYGNLFIKRFRLIDGNAWLYSENPSYSPVCINSDMEFKALGVVLYYIDKRNFEEKENEI